MIDIETIHKVIKRAEVHLEGYLREAERGMPGMFDKASAMMDLIRELKYMMED